MTLPCLQCGNDFQSNGKEMPMYCPACEEATAMCLVAECPRCERQYHMCECIDVTDVENEEPTF